MKRYLSLVCIFAAIACAAPKDKALTKPPTVEDARCKQHVFKLEHHKLCGK